MDSLVLNYRVNDYPLCRTVECEAAKGKTGLVVGQTSFATSPVPTDMGLHV